jgi:glucan phosphoethanolaminetransferase (alkaline phosphatase superfamily)
MSELTILIARTFAIFYLITGLGMLSNAKIFAKYMKDLEKNKGIMFMGSAFILMLGIVLVLSHNIWDKGPALLITIIAWLTFIKGTFFFLFPEHMFNMLKNWEAKESISAAGAVMILLGGLLGYVGFIL